jgi:hypothetical protein
MEIDKTKWMFAKRGVGERRMKRSCSSGVVAFGGLQLFAQIRSPARENCWGRDKTTRCKHHNQVKP